MSEMPMMGHLQKTSFLVVPRVRKGPGTGTSPGALRRQKTRQIAELEVVPKPPMLGSPPIDPAKWQCLGPIQGQELCDFLRKLTQTEALPWDLRGGCLSVTSHPWS